MNEEIIEILRNYDNLVLDIYDMNVMVRIDNEPFREATFGDKLDLLREEWFEVIGKLEELGYDIAEK